ncbi:MAM and LDL-receptor class A domain-containing protein 1 [Rhinophrynus dorsalis]
MSFVRPNQENGFQCSKGSFVPLDNLCDFTDQCGDYSDERLCSLYEQCDFERSLCGMTSDGWNRTNGVENISPPFDHKLNHTAQFLSFSSQNIPDEHAVLSSMDFLPTTSTASCQLRFYYYFGDVNGTLTVGLQMKTQDQMNVIWMQESNYKNVWRREVITISSIEIFKTDNSEANKPTFILYCDVEFNAAVKQGTRTVAEYAVEFRTLSYETDWNNGALRAAFRRGLSERIKDALVNQEIPDDLEGLISSCLELDRQQIERQLEKDRFRRHKSEFVPRSSPPTETSQPSVEPMDVGSVTKLPEEEKRRRRIRLSWAGGSVSTKAFVDSGAAGVFLDAGFASKHSIPLVQKAKPSRVSTVDGAPLGKGFVTHETQLLLLQTGILHSETIHLDVIQCPSSPVILGLPWLRLHNPVIDWSSDQITNWSSSCFSNCLSEIPVPGLVGGIGTPENSIPKSYRDFSDVFSKQKAAELPPHRSFDCSIDLLPGTMPPRGRTFLLSEPENKALLEYIQENLARGFIRHSSSPAGAGFFFVSKKDGTLRPCIDYRGLNKVTIKNRYPLPLIPELFDALKDAKIFTKLDLRGAYNLIRIKDGDEWKTAFNTRYGHYEYLVMPFGLCNAPATFQHFVNEIFKDVLLSYVVVYLDDILIFSSSLHEHREHVRTVLHRLRENHLYAKLEKCIFETSQLPFLGYIVSDSGLRMDPSKVESVSQWPRPITLRAVQRLLGFANYYRRFIKNFSAIVAPLVAFTKKNANPKVWSTEAVEAFERLKRLFVSAPLLRYPDPTQPFLIEVDASELGAGAVLSQRDEVTNRLHPCSYFSKQFSSAEKNYDTGNRELLAIKMALEEWRHLLEGSQVPVIIQTDHKNLQFLEQAQRLNPRQARWALFFTRFNFIITYIPGSKNRKADALSRLFTTEPDPPPEPIIPSNHIVASLSLSIVQRIKSLQHHFSGRVQGKPVHLLFVPKRFRSSLLKWSHHSTMAGHPGITKNIEFLLRRFWWPSLKQDVEAYVKACTLCTQNKPSTQRPVGLLQPLPVPQSPWTHLAMDFITDLPPSDHCTVIWVVVDRFSKQAHFVPLRGLPNSQTLADVFIKEVFRIHGVPAQIVSDRGTQFTSKFWKAFCSRLGIQLNFSSSYHPQSNGQTERTNQTLEIYLRHYVNAHHDNWASLLPLAEFAFNNRYHSALKCSPFYAALGYHPQTLPNLPVSDVPEADNRVRNLRHQWASVHRSLTAASSSYKSSADKKRQPAPSYQTGDQVWLSTQHLRLKQPSGSDVSCDFDVDTCGWTSRATAENIPWIRINGEENQTVESLSVKDSSDNIKGHFMILEGSNNTLQKRAFLENSVYYNTSKTCHFQFNYMIEEDHGLRLLMYTDELAFEGRIRIGQGFIALDGFSFIGCENNLHKAESSSTEMPSYANERCQSAESACDFQQDCDDGSDEDPEYCRKFNRCDFESGFCDWIPLTADGFSWNIAQGKDTRDQILPNTDHTSKNEYGHFIHFSTSLKQGKITSSQLESAFFVRPATSSAICQIILEAYLKSSNATIAVDDISLTSECGFTNNPLSAAKCDFETDSCGWYERQDADSFDWIRKSSSDLLPDYQKQAPPQDHTTNKSEGHFMFILKKNSTFSQMAELRSPKFSQAASGCTMTFWYYNYGLSVGAAEMLLHLDGETEPTVLWRVYYDQGNQWIKAFIHLDRLSQPFQLALNKISLGFYDGVSAIDDIIFENCSLPPAVDSCEGPDHFWCKKTKACISNLLVCDLIDNCGDGSDEDNCNPELQCNFEEGLCNWKQDFDDDFDWTRNQGSTPTPDTGPMKDHTLGTGKGHYLYIETSVPQVYQNQAVLLSPEIDATVNNANKTCIFRFHYHMFGKQIYSLAVYKRIMRNSRGNLLWQTFGNKGNRWLKKTLHINSSQPFQLLIVGMVGDGFTGDIGIDDLSLLDCALYKGILPTWSPIPVNTPTVPTLPCHNCTDEEYVCRSTGQCIPLTKICDFKPDCSDNSDEANCASEFCTFENGSTCQWFQPGASFFRRDTTFQWEIGKGSTIHPGEESHRPLKDHTLSSVDGSYLYADSSNGEFGHTAHIMTPVITHTGPRCKLAFWSYMNGATVGTLQVLIVFGNVTYELWSQSGKQGAQWNRAEVFLGTLSFFQIVLRAKRGVSYIGDVTVDDISFEECSPMLIPDRDCTSDEFLCSNKYCIPKDNLCDFVNDCADYSDEDPSICSTFFGRCDFEFDLCDWRQNQNDDFDWNLRSGSTPTIGTGPVIDHTLKTPSGYYIFIESSFPHLPMQVAKISGPMISRWSKHCKLIFHFYMFGKGIGSLSVYQVTISNKETLLLNLTGDQGNYWQKKELTISSREEDFYIIFEGKVGKDQQGDIALDDIVFTNECLPSSSSVLKMRHHVYSQDICPPGFWKCNNGMYYRPDQRCDFVDDCGDSTDENECGTSCTFENGICGWQNSLADNFDWMLGGHSSQALRPPTDHTIGNEKGHFLYLETSPVGLRGEKAHVKSSRWKESGADCTMSFWYYMSPKATGLIHVLIKTESALSKVWGESEKQDGKWNKVEIHLGKLRNFEVIFEGIRTRDFGGGAAIDDIEFRDCSTVGEVPGKCPTETDFVCRNKKCIESHLVCDYKPDCEDLSDETDCSEYTNVSGSCNFDYQDQSDNLGCDLTQDQSDDFDWSVGTKGLTGLNTDHTPGSGKYFLYINSSMKQEGDIAKIFTTNIFKVTNGTCRVRFWYLIHGQPHSGTLKLYLMTSHGLNILYWSATESREMRWMYANVVLSSNSPFRVAFEAQVGGEQLVDIALDDISFTLDCNVEGPLPPAACPSELFTCAYVKECLPLSAQCNGTEDCMDGTDEINCPTTLPNTEPSIQCKETEFQCADRTCIPSMMWCDGVPDCSIAEDEYNCTTQICLNGSLLCVSTNTCVPTIQRCDGIFDCSEFGIDESSCSVCPDGYCKNGGECVFEKEVPLCKCTKKWKGNRCHLRETHLPSKPIEDNTNGMWIGVGIGITLLITQLVVVFFCFYCKR